MYIKLYYQVTDHSMWKKKAHRNKQRTEQGPMFTEFMNDCHLELITSVTHLSLRFICLFVREVYTFKQLCRPKLLPPFGVVVPRGEFNVI